ncbi:hypothetical protein ACHAWO_011177 [Cyclotella atomus]|uniref:Splicing factor YJU2 n=1 Tax=Cyclotella atomus TaxID=382360 RepID=A0ABD3NST4_9STRA
MGERKVLNKYIPADFDPQLVPRGKKPVDGLIPVRMMLPFSIQCSTCSTFLYRGRKFNSKKEAVKGVDGKYLGIQRYRFYIKCGGCSRPVTFLTDPKNADYEMESGGTRNYEVWHDERKTNEQFEKEAEEDEKMDGMKALENRVLESQREMAELDALEEIRAMNARHVKLMGKRGGSGGEMDAAQAVLNAREANLAAHDHDAKEDVELNENGLTHDEEELVKSMKFGKSQPHQSEEDAGTLTIHRLDEKDEMLAEQKRREEAEALVLNKRKNVVAESKKSMPVFIKKKKRKVDDTTNNKDATDVKKKEPAAAEAPTGLSGLLGYDSSCSDSD